MRNEVASQANRNRWLFSFFRKFNSDSSGERSSTGNEFHTFGPAEEKVLKPESLFFLGMMRSNLDEERSCERPSANDVEMQSSAR